MEFEKLDIKYKKQTYIQRTYILKYFKYIKI